MWIYTIKLRHSKAAQKNVLSYLQLKWRASRTALLMIREMEKKGATKLAPACTALFTTPLLRRWRVDTPLNFMIVGDRLLTDSAVHYLYSLVAPGQEAALVTFLKTLHIPDQGAQSIKIGDIDITMTRSPEKELIVSSTNLASPPTKPFCNVQGARLWFCDAPT